MTSLFVVLFLATMTFLLVEKAAASVLEPQILRRLRHAFLVLTLAAFLSPSVWVYLAALLLFMGGWGVACAFHPALLAVAWGGLLLAAPDVPAYLPGFGGIQSIMVVSHVTVLNLALLLPAALVLFRTRGNTRFGQLALDWLVSGYLVWQLALAFGSLTLTDVARNALLLLLNAWLPYWVLSRALTSLEDLRRFQMAFVLGAMISAAVALIEVTMGWPIYDAVEGAWKIDWALSTHLMRGNLLRARAAAGHSLVLGFYLVVTLGLWLAVRRSMESTVLRTAITALLLAGLLASLARGAWVGGAAMVALLVVLSPRVGAAAALLVLVVGAAIAIVTTVPSMQGLVDFLPFIGNVDSDNIDYREKLLEVALALIEQSPWFGVPNYLAQMEELRQGQGIIDIVNTYLGVTLNTGVIGLALYGGAFVTACVYLARLRFGTQQDGEIASMAAQLLAILMAAILMLFTVSSIAAIYPLTYMLLGLAANCWQLRAPARKHAQSAQAGYVTL